MLNYKQVQRSLCLILKLCIADGRHISVFGCILHGGDGTMLDRKMADQEGSLPVLSFSQSRYVVRHFPVPRCYIARV